MQVLEKPGAPHRPSGSPDGDSLPIRDTTPVDLGHYQSGGRADDAAGSNVPRRTHLAKGKALERPAPSCRRHPDDNAWGQRAEQKEGQEPENPDGPNRIVMMQVLEKPGAPHRPPGSSTRGGNPDGDTAPERLPSPPGGRADGVAGSNVPPQDPSGKGKGAGETSTVMPTSDTPTITLGTDGQSRGRGKNLKIRTARTAS